MGPCSFMLCRRMAPSCRRAVYRKPHHAHSLQEVNVVYQHLCTVGDCSHLNSRYIGFTSTALSKRITAHLQDGAIRRHYMNEHGLIQKRHHMKSNTTILAKENDLRRLKMTETVHIHSEKPTINIQQQPESSLPYQRQPNGAATGRSLAASNTTQSAVGFTLRHGYLLPPPI
ncbi:hypothetical protein E2C01_073128 [Portunus trituberculatus]|uniref:GIY-YIG domain-containing protein n=1 Tax=Portunus trituberculatus TaxID=210409 RepID=A0A5B7I923_PORTR|nr:hypothetical protein [Portunus trituberculatus]